MGGEKGEEGMVRTGKRNFFCISSFQALAMFRRSLFYSYLSIYLRHFLGLTVTETTLFATFPMVLNIVFQTFVWGGISDRFQKRRTLIILGELFAAISTFFVWLLHIVPESRHAAGYVIIFGLTGVEIFWSMSNVGWTAIISDFYPERERTGVQGKLGSIGAIGSFIGIWIGGLAYDGLSRLYEGWGFDRGVLFFIASGVMAISTIPVFFIPEGGVSSAERAAINTRRATIGTAGILSYAKPFLVFLLAMVFINFGRNSIAVIKSQYLTLDSGFNVSSALLGYIMNMTSVSTFIMGLVIARLSRRLNDEALLLIGAVLAILSLLGFAIARRLEVIFVSNFIAGISEVIIFSASYTFASKLIPAERRGKQFALFNATFFLSWGIAATFIAGPIVDLLAKSGVSADLSYRMAFLSAAVFVFAGLFVLLSAYRMRRPMESASRALGS
jgi:MFS family permease